MEKFLILTMEGCSGCNQVKEDLKGSNIKICDIEKEECSKMAEDLDIEFVPVAIRMNDDGSKDVCYLDKKGSKIVAKCKDKEHVIWQK